MVKGAIAVPPLRRRATDPEFFRSVVNELRTRYRLRPVTVGPTTTALAAPTRRASTEPDVAPPTRRVLELGAVLALAAPLEVPGDGLARVRAALEQLSRELVALGGQPLPPPAGLEWGAGAPGGELVGAPADAATLAAGRSAASSWAAAVVPLVLATSPRAAAERIRAAFAQVVAAASFALGAGVALPAALARALTAWVFAAQTAVNTLGSALMVGVGAGTGTAWLILAALAVLYFARKR